MRVLLFIWVCLSILGCQSLKDATNARAIEARKNRSVEDVTLEHRHDKYVGKNEDFLIEDLGAPDRVDNVGSYKIYYYITDRGITSESSGATYGGASIAQGHIKSHGQTSRFYFKNGVVLKWDYEAR